MVYNPPMIDSDASLHNEEKQILGVSALARQARLLLEERFHLLWVEGRGLKPSPAEIWALVFHSQGRQSADPLRHVCQ